jgi:hypothetical protein
MNKLLVIPILFVLSWRAMAQDERYFRQLFSGEINKEKKILGPEKKYTYYIPSPYYAIDLNRDGRPEQILFIKKDNEDWINILDSDKREIFAYRFENKGFDSELFKVEMKTLSPTATVLLLYYYEGVSKYIDFQGTARIYVITFDNNDLKTLSAMKGPSFYDEVKNFRGHYHKRAYDVYLEDLNGDSVKELIVKFHDTSYVYMYKGAGRWQAYN